MPDPLLLPPAPLPLSVRLIALADSSRSGLLGSPETVLWLISSTHAPSASAHSPQQLFGHYAQVALPLSPSAPLSSSYFSCLAHVRPFEDLLLRSSIPLSTIAPHIAAHAHPPSQPPHLLAIASPLLAVSLGLVQPSPELWRHGSLLLPLPPAVASLGPLLLSPLASDPDAPADTVALLLPPISLSTGQPTQPPGSAAVWGDATDSGGRLLGGPALKSLLVNTLVHPGQLVGVDWCDRPEAIVVCQVHAQSSPLASLRAEKPVPCRSFPSFFPACALDYLQSSSAPGSDPAPPATACWIRDSTRIVIITGDSAALASPPSWQQPSPAIDSALGDCVRRVAALLPATERHSSRILSYMRTRLHAHFQSPPVPFLSSVGCIVHGLSGTGKTHTVEALVTQLRASRIVDRVTWVNCPDVFKQDEGESEAFLRSKFFPSSDVPATATHIVVLDELDSLASTVRTAASGQVERRILLELVTLLERVQPLPVFVVGITGTLDLVDPILRQSGRLDNDVFFASPKPRERLAILTHLTRKMALVPGEDASSTAHFLPKVAGVTHGYVGADLLNLCREAALESVRRAFRHDSGTPRPSIPGVSWADFVHALSVCTPASMAEYKSLNLSASTLRSTLSNAVEPRRAGQASVALLSSYFSALAGVQSIVDVLVGSVLLPLCHPRLYRSLHISPPRGVLLHGPSGTGKSRLALMLAAATGLNTIPVHAAEIVSKVVGDSEKNLARLFRQARASAPCVVILDQIEILAQSRSEKSSTSDNSSTRILSCLLTEMDGLSKLSRTPSTLDAGVALWAPPSHDGEGESDALLDEPFDDTLLFIATTSRLSKLDAALLRPGRFDVQVYLPLPDETARADILKLYLERFGWFRGDASAEGQAQAELRVVENTAAGTIGYTGADLEAVCREAGMIAVREKLESRSGEPGAVRADAASVDVRVTAKHVEQALSVIQPRQ